MLWMIKLTAALLTPGERNCQLSQDKNLANFASVGSIMFPHALQISAGSKIEHIALPPPATHPHPTPPPPVSPPLLILQMIPQSILRGLINKLRTRTVAW